MSKSFVHELPLRTLPKDVCVLNIRFNMARFLYNAVLAEGFRRLSLIKQSKIYNKAKKLPKSKTRTKLFKEAFKEHQFSDYDLQKFAINVKNNCDIGKHLDTHSSQKIATRTYRAIKEYSILKRGRPRFKGKDRLHSVEGKSNAAGIRFRKNVIYWKDLALEVILDLKDKYGLQNHALSSKTKYCRIVRKKIKGKDQFFVQLVQEGTPFIKTSSKKAKVGLDIGPSSLAVCSEKKAMLTPFCKELEENSQNIKLLQRKMDRSLRFMNKGNYDNKNRVKNKKLSWKKSKNYLEKQNELSESYRKLKEYRKRLHGNLANTVLALGNIIKTEKVSYKGWQKNYGKSINFRAPSMFLNMLSRKAENAGGYLEEFSTKTTCLSQICHNCETKKKKPLSQRWHICSCNIEPAQRDLYSAFLALHVTNNRLDINQAKKAWTGAHPLLEQAISRLNQTAIGKSRLTSFGLSRSQSGSLVKDKSIINKAKNVVRVKPESLGEFINTVVKRTP